MASGFWLTVGWFVGGGWWLRWLAPFALVVLFESVALTWLR